MTHLTRAEAVTRLTEAERVTIWTRASRLNEPCVFCDAPDWWVIKFLDERDRQFELLACDPCAYAFNEQVDPLSLGDHVPAARVVAVLSEGMA